MLDKLPTTWDTTNARLDSSKQTVADLETKVRELKPKIEDSLARAEKTIAEMRESAVKSLQEAQTSITGYRKDALESTRDLRKTAAEYKESIPDKIHDARVWSDRFLPTVAKIDNFCSRADDQLDKGIDSLKMILRGYQATAIELEHTAYNIKTWPWLLSKAPDTEDKELYFDSIWKRDLAHRQFRELRSELLRTRESLRASGSVDQSRMSHIDQLLRETEVDFPALPNEVAPATEPAPAPTGRKK
jgi:ElaB/YqjD/DUF883 family membrane-anchored ribosome-binding protein